MTPGKKDSSKKKILLIDDDTNLLTTLKDFLKSEGYDVLTADSGEQGLKRLTKTTPDLIILDMSMPGMGGMGFLKEISSPDGKPRYPVLVLTARANMAEFFANVEVDGFVAKPCDPGDLLMEVGRIIFLRSSEAGGLSTGAKKDERKKVLLGEDDASIKDVLVAAIADAGYLVECVVSGPEILEKAIVRRPDVIVMKRILHQMNGDSVAEMLKTMPNTKSIPVVLYEVGGDTTASPRAVDPGGNVKAIAPNSNSVTILAAMRSATGG